VHTSHSELGELRLGCKILKITRYNTIKIPYTINKIIIFLGPTINLNENPYSIAHSGAVLIFLL
jgi:hypothetical protein